MLRVCASQFKGQSEAEWNDGAVLKYVLPHPPPPSLLYIPPERKERKKERGKRKGKEQEKEANL